MTRYRWALALATAVMALLLGTTPARASAGNVVAAWHVAPGFYDLSAGADAMWVARVDEYHRSVLYRINPDTNQISRVATLPFAGGGVVAAYGSVWISDYLGNAVWRLTPTGTVRAVIRTGLQPQWLTAAFGSLWTSNHHGGSLTRIDPRTDEVLATVPAGAPRTFRDGPQDLTADGHRLYVGSSNLRSLQRVQPSDNTVTTPPPAGDDTFCGELVVAGGSVWSIDLCTNTLYQLGKDGTVDQVLPADPAAVLSETVLDGTLWVSEDRDGANYSSAVLVARGARTGTVQRTVHLGGDASTVRAGFGDLWVFDANRGTIRRVHV